MGIITKVHFFRFWQQSSLAQPPAAMGGAKHACYAIYLSIYLSIYQPLLGSQGAEGGEVREGG